jgi:uncharacterized RDD family membrane protein YckC
MGDMSTNGPEEPPQRRMPWEPETPEPAPTPPDRPAEGWVPPLPTDPTTVWTPAPAIDPSPTSPPPWQPTPEQGSVISSAPVGWSAPPPAATEVAPGLALADTTSRFVAYIIDLVLLLFVISVVAAVLDVSTTTVTDAGAITEIRNPVSSILYALVGMAYFVISWTGGRRSTIGQRIFNIQVGNAFDGRALSLEQAIRRWLGLGSWIALFGLVPGLVSLSGVIELLWAIILLITTATSPTKQGLHDRFANTALVRPSGQGTSGLATACLIVVVVLAALVLLSIVALIFLGSQMSTILSEVGESI